MSILPVFMSMHFFTILENSLLPEVNNTSFYLWTYHTLNVLVRYFCTTMENATKTTIFLLQDVSERLKYMIHVAQNSEYKALNTTTTPEEERYLYHPEKNMFNV